MWSFVSFWWLTPKTTVRSALSPGAEISTRLAPGIDVLQRLFARGEEPRAFERDVDL